MNNAIEQKDKAVEADKIYHTRYYRSYGLGDQDSWLTEPEEFVTRHIGDIPRNGLTVDLGCGPGRLSIPILRHLCGSEGRLICIDRIDEALSRLREHTRSFADQDRPIILNADLEHFHLVGASVDAVVVWSVWEATFSPPEIHEKLVELSNAIRPGGVALLMFNTEIQCFADQSRKVGIAHHKRGNMSSQFVREMLSEVFSGWTDTEIFERNDCEIAEVEGQIVEWTSVHIMYFGRKREE